MGFQFQMQDLSVKDYLLNLKFNSSPCYSLEFRVCKLKLKVWCCFLATEQIL